MAEEATTAKGAVDPANAASPLQEVVLAGIGEEGDAAPLAVFFGQAHAERDQPWADHVVPDGWERELVPLAGALEWSEQPPTDRPLLLVAPFVSANEWGAAWSACRRDDGWTHWRIPVSAVLLLRTLARAERGQRVATHLPTSTFATSSAGPRDRLFTLAAIRLLVEVDRAFPRQLGIHGSFQLTVVCCKRRDIDDRSEPSRFLKISGNMRASDVRHESRRLLKQGGGTTAHGFVERDPLSPSRPLLYSAYDPARHERVTNLRALGRVQPLREIFSVGRGMVRTTRDEKKLGNQGAPVLGPRELAGRWPPDLTDAKRIRDPDPEMQLRAGDVCIPGFRAASNDPLVARRIEESDLPVLAMQQVLVLRPVVSLDARHRDFVLDYLRSERAAALLAHELGGGLHLRSDELGELLVPLPDESLLVVLTDLHEAEQRLREWGDDVGQAIEGILGDTAADRGILELRSTGQLLRQRVAAARQLDDLSYRVRTLFPFPVALPWRRVQTGNRDLEGYVTILECAEALAGYLAVLAVLTAQSCEYELGSVRSLRDKLASTPHGVSMGDWTGIVREMVGQSFVRQASESTPFIELTELMADDTVAWTALDSLTQRRNDQAHGRGPKGARVEPAFEEALDALTDLYQSCEWLGEYPLRLIDDTRWDSYSNSGSYSYRELVGDHYLVAPKTEPTARPTLNKSSLYVRDRQGHLHLASPLLLWHNCETCGVPSAFILDAFDSQAAACRMRTMDHDHVINRTDVVAPLAQIGLLPGVSA